MDFISIVLYVILPLLTTFLLSGLRWKKPLPPGPKGWPIIGNMLMMNQLTHHGLANLAETYGGILHLKMGFRHTVAVSSPEIARQVLQVQDNIFSNRPATIAIAYLTYDRQDMAFANYGPFWRQMRKLCVMKLFSRKRVESWDSVRDEVDSMIKITADSSGSPVNLGELVFGLTHDIIYRAAFGSISHEGKEEFIRILQEYTKLFGAFNLADFIPWLGFIDPAGLNTRLPKARAALDGFIDKIIDEHLKKKKKTGDDADSDMVDEMLAFYCEEGNINEGEDMQNVIKLTRNNIKAIIMDVMFGGTETVASAIEWALTELMHTPESLKRVQQELADVVGLDRRVEESDFEKLTYFKCVIKEVLRLHPPIPLLLHQSSSDTEVAGYHIPKGTRVMVNVYAVNRDKSAWEDPNTFNPLRFLQNGAPDFKGSNYEFIPFGSGRRSCPGMQLGLYALEMAVAHLLHSFTWQLPDGMKPSEIDMTDVFGLTAPKAIRLVAVPTPRLLCPLY
ncbi:putative cytochrome P450 [Helianthus annuus]|uniref:Cytochrome P450 n=1 Tax=Helianthus annuus TaxID=4232 RepID=A0A251SAC1_HELAN|nr:cytochrome P450 84A1 [Helianthus annuus]KAF5765132.1 putative cytochrome P450 [Helianthus annuus]KAJ0451705.1 putative cytochrome P450 [Helianthus annuus]KAJ0456347.1 putative cytochrome P450 [Helianthus annuus]KAJ0473590.1 putative cytochrome P450 [Helianthus annuus]KAJ0649168.1 putative cytochrome P450 [Helianthus annuus]